MYYSKLSGTYFLHKTSKKKPAELQLRFQILNLSRDISGA